MAFFEEFQGRRRIFVCWVKRISLKETNWSPIAALTSDEAHEERRKAEKEGDVAFVESYLRAKDLKR